MTKLAMAPQTFTTTNPRRPTSAEVRQGSVLWLGTKIDTLNSFSQRGYANFKPVERVRGRMPVSDGMFSHPIIVLSRSASNPDKIVFAVVTSFSAHNNQLPKRKKSLYVPLTPAPDTTERYEALTFENNDVMARACWVSITQIYQMYWRDAELYWGNNPLGRTSWTLDQPSIHRLLSYASLNFGAQYQEAYNVIPTIPGILASASRQATIVSPYNHQTPVVRVSTIQHAQATSDLPPSAPAATFYQVYTSQRLIKAEHQRPNILDEETPLLPQQRSMQASERHDGIRKSFCQRVWAYLAKTRLGIILHYLFG